MLVASFRAYLLNQRARPDERSSSVSGANTLAIEARSPSRAEPLVHRHHNHAIQRTQGLPAFPAVLLRKGIIATITLAARTLGR